MWTTLLRSIVLVVAFSAMPTASAEPPRAATDCSGSGCHVKPARAAFVHPLVDQGDCTACHQLAAPGGKFHPAVVSEPAVGEISLSTNPRCQPCHDDHQLRHDTRVADIGACGECHDPHGGDSRALLRGSRGEICLSCHADGFEPSLRRGFSSENAEPRSLESEFQQHGVVAEDRCAACHSMHSGTPKDLLRGAFPASNYAEYDRAIYSNCLESCHPPELVEAQPTTTTTRFRNGDDNLHFRHVAARPRGRSCRLCHASHQARNSGLMRAGMRFGKEQLTLEFSASETGGRCATSCHLPAEYDRELAIPSRMRVQELNSIEEKKP